MTVGRLPAEWEPQSGLMITWPHPATDWQPLLEEAEVVFTDIAVQACPFQVVLVVCQDNDHCSHVRYLLEKSGVDIKRCRFHIAASNDSWARDHGPISIIIDDAVELLDFTFNGWGNKYPADLDNRINSALYQSGAFGECAMRQLDFVLEGGSLETDGLGTMLTTTSCLLSPQRNSHFNQAEIEEILRQELFVERILWLQHGQLQGDDTDGHIDTLVRFADPQTLLYVESGNTDNPNHASLHEMHRELLTFRQADGRPYNLVALPCPVIRDDNGRLLPASYVNFVIINRAVLVPMYGVDEDAAAMKIFSKYFPDRTIIAIDCRVLVRQYGSLHCVTMNLPQGVLQ